MWEPNRAWTSTNPSLCNRIWKTIQACFVCFYHKVSIFIQNVKAGVKPREPKRLRDSRTFRRTDNFHSYRYLKSQRGVSYDFFSFHCLCSRTCAFISNMVLKIGDMQSRPTRARGLKLDRERTKHLSILVAPHAGAWIETRYFRFHSPYNREVAPHAGAWIETSSRRRCRSDIAGRAPRGRVD